MRFKEDIHKALWGEESWLVSAHPSAPSLLADGSGRTLREVCPSFPLLAKVIRANLRLSVQVHPNDRTATSVGGEAKTEMWCVLKAGPIFAGFRPGTTAAAIERAVEDGSFEDLLVRFDAKVGECFYIPGGLVHAIGEGTTVFEVQQSSDTTFRLYDWGRVGADGRPRQLHVKQALAAMDLSLPPPVPSAAVSCPYFDFRRVAAGTLPPSDAWRIVYTPETDETDLLPPHEDAVLFKDAFVVTA